MDFKISLLGCDALKFGIFINDSEQCTAPVFNGESSTKGTSEINTF
jgi:hypothetical protein